MKRIRKRMPALAAGSWNVSGRRLLLTLFCLVAFTFQSFVAATHIHIPGTVDSVAGLTAGTHHNKLPAPYPDDDSSKCPYCQVAAAMGAAIGPNALLLLQPAATGVVLAIAVTRVLARPAPSHVWQSRGPPSA